MSQLVLDDQLDLTVVLPPIRRWITVQRIGDLRLREKILDDRIPEILRSLKQPTLVTIDQDFWERRLCHPDYGILYFALESKQQVLLPDLLRALLLQPEFRTRARRMGKVARVSTALIEYWQFPAQALQRLPWEQPSRRKR